MSRDASPTSSATKFRVFSRQRVFPGARLETIAVPGIVKAGPADDRMYVVDALDKLPYRDERAPGAPHLSVPPYAGPMNPAVEPRDGHFDHIDPNDRAFSVAGVFAMARHVLDFWERHLGEPVAWHFSQPRLEIVPFVETENAWSGDGFIEFGYPKFRRRLERDRSDPFCENFDAVAHELGHLILKAVIGNPAEKTVDHHGHEEGCADLIALLASLGFPTEVDRVLDETDGQLFSINALSRLAEWNIDDEIRELFNEVRAPEARAARAEGDKHTLSLQFSGAVYDLLVALYVLRLADAGLAGRDVRRGLVAAPRATLAEVQRGFPAHMPRSARLFREALVGARDELAQILIRAWRSERGRVVDYPLAVRCVVEAAGPNADIAGALFAWRGLA